MIKPNPFDIQYGDYVKCKLPNKKDVAVAKFEWITSNGLYIVNLNGIHYYIYEKNILGKANEDDLQQKEKSKINNIASNVLKFLARKARYNMDAATNNNNNNDNKEQQMLDIVTQ